ncbi:hypothetical protein [Pseudarthrobacter sp. MEB009]|uniref:hypothetical protein n=1 Tax=Pseudarthrobacter sp. MEB009 TaxID=3040326 RepID=UPI002556DC63|nr:hypothetical protein [Pseudarthrobacter sp. MEB009]
MNSDEVWLLQLWSGVFGAAIGALAAAAVALLVVNLTNRHQSRLSAKAIAAQMALAAEALVVQKKHAEDALKAQEDSSLRQLREQNEESSRNRQIAAVADMISSALELVDRADETLEDIQVLRQRMMTAWIRFSLELPVKDSDGGEEFFHWPGHLASLAMDVLEAKLTKQPHKTAFDVLNDATSAFSTLARYWMRIGSEERLAVSKILENARLNPTATRTMEDFFSPLQSSE